VAIRCRDGDNPLWAFARGERAFGQGEPGHRIDFATGISIWISHAVLSAGLQSEIADVVQIVAGGFLKAQQAKSASC
jgi:hypothetical protein